MNRLRSFLKKYRNEVIVGTLVYLLQNHHFRRGELHSPSHDTDTFPYCRNNGIFLRVTGVFARYLNGWMICWVHGKWQKK